MEARDICQRQAQRIGCIGGAEQRRLSRGYSTSCQHHSTIALFLLAIIRLFIMTKIFLRLCNHGYQLQTPKNTLLNSEKGLYRKTGIEHFDIVLRHNKRYQATGKRDTTSQPPLDQQNYSLSAIMFLDQWSRSSIKQSLLFFLGRSVSPVAAGWRAWVSLLAHPFSKSLGSVHDAAGLAQHREQGFDALARHVYYSA